MGPQNAIMGDAGDPFAIPQTETPEPDLTLEKNMARFSKTREFEALKQTIQQRQAYHKQYSPGSSGETAFRDMPNEERGWRSLAADLVISELQMIIDAYETANTVVEDAKETEKRRRKSARSGPTS